MRRRRLLALVVALAVVAIMGATSAFAGEITGNGKDTPIRDRANSECAFSGLDDADDDGFGRTQSWGQIPKADRDFLRSIGVAPETLCNGHKNPMNPRN
jgi:hypothetical protein